MFQKAVRWFLSFGFAFVCSFCAHENVILCFTSQAFINHSSALCFVSDTINATSWHRENERTERQRTFFFLFFFLCSHHIICTGIWKLDPWTSSTPLESKQACIVAGEEWLEEEGGDTEEAKQTQKKLHRKNIILRPNAYKEDLWQNCWGNTFIRLAIALALLHLSHSSSLKWGWNCSGQWWYLQNVLQASRKRSSMQL